LIGLAESERRERVLIEAPRHPNVGDTDCDVVKHARGRQLLALADWLEAQDRERRSGAAAPHPERYGSAAPPRRVEKELDRAAPSSYRRLTEM
jgi:hypothetical protein